MDKLRYAVQDVFTCFFCFKWKHFEYTFIGSVNWSYVDHTMVAQEAMPWPGIGWQRLDNGRCLERINILYVASTRWILRFLPTLILWCGRFISFLIEKVLRSLSVSEGRGRVTCNPFGGTFSIPPPPFCFISLCFLISCGTFLGKFPIPILLFITFVSKTRARIGEYYSLVSTIPSLHVLSSQFCEGTEQNSTSMNI